MPHHRGPENLAQRRAQYRCPGRPPHLRACLRPPPSRVQLRPPPPVYDHRHRRPQDIRAFIEFCEELGRKLERTNHAIRRLAKALHEDDLRDAERAFGMAHRESARRLSHSSTTTSTYDNGQTTTIRVIPWYTTTTTDTTTGGSYASNW